MSSERAHDNDVEEKRRKAQRARNIAIALSLAAFVVILYVATWAKLGANVLNRPL
jgi:hypothetical protein